MKMPTKAELLKLQARYRTDRRIAEALGGNVTEHLVEYWRRKKGIPRRSFPKYSEAQIRELWERFGDDFRCGRELGLSKAGFYSWRRRYGIKEKPRTLKLEQLELRFGSEPKMGRNGVFIEYYRTAAQKILAENSGLKQVEYGEVLEISPDLIVLNASARSKRGKFDVSGKIAEKVRLVIGPGGCLSTGNVDGVRTIPGVFSLLQVDDVVPSTVIAQNDSLAAGLSALSALSFTIDESQVAEVLSSGTFSLTVPAVVRIALQDRLQRGVAAFDTVAYAASNLPTDVFENHIVEYTGSVVERLDIYERICLCQLTQVCGSICAYAVFDEMTRKFLAKRGRTEFKVWFSDSKAFYDQDYVLTVSGLEPQVAPAGDFASSRRVRDMQEIKPISLAFIGGACAGGVETIRQISELLKGQRVNESVRLFLSPFTEHVYIEAMKRRLLIPIAEAGATILPPGFNLADIPGFDENTQANVLTTPCSWDGDYPDNCWFVNHLTAATSAVKGALACYRR